MEVISGETGGGEVEPTEPTTDSPRANPPLP